MVFMLLFKKPTVYTNATEIIVLVGDVLTIPTTSKAVQTNLFGVAGAAPGNRRRIVNCANRVNHQRRKRVLSKSAQPRITFAGFFETHAGVS